MLVVSAIVVLALLLYLPGFLLASALLGPARYDRALERHYEYVVAGALLNGWVAFTLAELGWFSAWLHTLLVGTVAVAAALIAWRRGALRVPAQPLGIVARGRDGGLGTAAAFARLAARWEAIGFVIIGAIFVALVSRPFEVVLGVRDAGVYSTTGFAIARTGGIVQYDALLAQIGQEKKPKQPESAEDRALREAAEQAETNFLGTQNAERAIATRLRTAGYYVNEGELAAGRVVPQFLHLFPAWIALLTSMLGMQGGLLATGLMGLLGVWGVGMLGQRLAGRWVGLLGMLFLALNGVQVWFSRYSTAEACAQFLIFAGLYGFAVMHDGPGAQPQAGALPTGRRPLVAGRQEFAALLAGVAIGQLALARLDFLIVALPVVAYLFYAWLTGRWTRVHTLFAAGLGALLLHAAVHIIFIARAYFLDTLFARLQDQSILLAALVLPFLTDTLRRVYVTTSRSVFKQPFRLLIELALLQVILVVSARLRRDGRSLAWFEGLLARHRGLALKGIALLIVLAMAYAYFVRPGILGGATLAALPGCLAPAQLSGPVGACRDLQGYVGAPIKLPEGRPVYTIPLANFVRFGWYLSPLGVVLGVAGLALWLWRGLNRASWLFLALGLAMTFFFVRQSYGTDEQTYIYILRRFVPLVYPAFCLGMAYALVALAGWGRAKEAGGWAPLVPRLAAGVCALALVSFLALTNRTIYRHVEYAGALDQLAQIAGRFGPGDVLLFRGGDHIYGASRDRPDLIVTPLKFAFGLDAFTIKSREPGNYAAQLARYVERWQAQGRQVYLVLGASGAVGLPGFRLEPAGRIGLDLQEFEQLTNQKPLNTHALRADYAVYRLVPGAAIQAPAGLAVGEYAAQVRGFYPVEQSEAMAWTDGDALLRLPWPQDGRPLTLTLRLAGGSRPASLGPAQVTVMIRPEPSFHVDDPAAPPFVELARLTLREEPAGYTVTLDPRALAAPPTGTFLLRLASDAWVPAASDIVPPSNDRRGLGVQYGGVGVAP